MRRRSATALATCLTAFLAVQVWAGELAGFTLPGQTTVGESTRFLNGMVLREAPWLRINVYAAGLYIETRSSDADAILGGEHPERSIIVFVRSVGRKSVINDWDAGLLGCGGA